jgi:hypothetical protein
MFDHDIEATRYLFVRARLFNDLLGTLVCRSFISWAAQFRTCGLLIGFSMSCGVTPVHTEMVLVRDMYMCAK